MDWSLVGKALVGAVGAGAAYVAYRNSIAPPNPSGKAKPSGEYDTKMCAYIYPSCDKMTKPLQKAVLRAAESALEGLGDGRSRRAVDCCCGTGQFAELMERSGAFDTVLGIDLSPQMLAAASRRAAANPKLNFTEGDVTEALAAFPAEHFDVASVLLALHEMPRKYRVPMLKEMARCSRIVVACDFAADMPLFSSAGVRNRLIEFAAGRDHWSNNRDFRFVSGGLRGLAKEAGLEVVSEKFVDGRTMHIAVMRRRQ